MTTQIGYRIASETEGFPYASSHACFIEQSPGGQLAKLHYKDDFEAALARARGGESQIFAVWPGSYRSDLFLVDDLDALAVARKLR